MFKVIINALKAVIKRVSNFVVKRKILSLIILVVVVAGVVLTIKSFSGSSGEIKYTLTTVEKGTLINTVSGSGQVSASKEVAIKSEVSGDVVWVGVKVGDEVKNGQALVGLDKSEILESIKDAKQGLSDAEIALEKASVEAPIDYQDKLETVADAQKSLEDEYDDVFNTVSNVYLSLPSLMTNMQTILYGTTLDRVSSQQNVYTYRNLFSKEDGDLVNNLADVAEENYKLARDAYDENFVHFKDISLNSSDEELEAILEETIAVAKLVVQAVKSSSNLLDTIVDTAEQHNISINSTISTYKNNLGTYLTSANSLYSSLSNQESSLETAKKSVTSAENSLTLYKIGNPTGINPSALQSAQRAYDNQVEALSDLQEDLANCIVYSPISGTISAVNVEVGDSVSSANAVATVISDSQIAEISLNEVDAANVKVGQRATMTFDAIDDLTMTGKVTEVDAVGTVSQGVVTYNVVVSFDTQNANVKPGMSVSVDIATEVAQDVLYVSSSAVKSSGDVYYVEVLEDANSSGGSSVTSKQGPVQVQVEIGMMTDSETQIISGLNEGDQVVLRTISSSTSSSSSNSSSKSTSNSITNTLTGSSGGGMMGGSAGGPPGGF